MAEGSGFQMTQTGKIIIAVIVIIVLASLISPFLYKGPQKTTTTTLQNANATNQTVGPTNSSTNSSRGQTSGGTGSMIIYCIGGLQNLTTVKNTYYFNASSPFGLPARWLGTTPYPVSEQLASCVTYGNQLYCIGGTDANYSALSNASYYAGETPSGLGAWHATASYPIPTAGESCAVYANYIYCTGGENGPADFAVGAGASGVYVPATNQSFYAPISSTGIGPWAETTPYPIDVMAPSCYVYNAAMYCIGNSTVSVPGLALTTKGINPVYYAKLSAAGIGPWKQATNSQVGNSSIACSAGGGYAYCLTYSQSYVNDEGFTNTSSYYASLARNGTGKWLNATSIYPVSQSTLYAMQCRYVQGYMYCIGGENSTSYFASAGQYGIGGWRSFADYPGAIAGQSCTA